MLAAIEEKHTRQVRLNLPAFNLNFKKGKGRGLNAIASLASLFPYE
jgi:hypothetical protein